MKRATITVPDDVEVALEAYRRDREVPPSLTAVAEVALREFLTGRGYLAPRQALRIQPAPKGSGHADTSIAHDRYVAER